MRIASEPERFRYIAPPFEFNAANIARYPAEVTGYHLLNSMRRRLGWSTLAGKRILDFGCGVRFTRTIYNLDLEIGLYAGVDVNADAIAWLADNVDDPRFRFERLEMGNALYNPGGLPVSDTAALRARGLVDFDAACMFSVITHQAPDDAAIIFALVYESVRDGGQLYFTAFTDESVGEYAERDPAAPCHVSTYHPEYLRRLVAGAGWRVEDVYPASEPTVQQAAFVCRK
jgi:SAM-dependent methyltransferase